MAIMNPSHLPTDRRHLDEDDRAGLLRFEFLLEQTRFDEAHDLVEDLWAVATDAHKDLYKGLANALAAVIARGADQQRGAAEIAQRCRVILAPYPRLVLGFDLDALLDSVESFVERGEGHILVRRRG